jgi:polar amino acid transport system permease protein
VNIAFNANHVVFLLQAAGWTLVLSLIAFVGGGLLGFIVALCRISPIRALRWLSTGYVQLVQGTPLLILMFLAYFGLSIVGLSLPALVAAGISMTIYVSAYIGEIWRGCIQAVPRTQWEAAECLALSRVQRMGLVVLPQALRIATPPTVGFMVQIVKNTSLASVVGFVELARAGQVVNNSCSAVPGLHAGRRPLLPAVLPAVVVEPAAGTPPAGGPSRAAGRPKRHSPAVRSADQLDNVHKSFGALKVLDGVSFSVNKGEVFAIIGRSGSGKSTALRCIDRLESIDQGRIQVCGHEVSDPKLDLRQLRRDVGIVFQSYNLFPHLTAAENIALAPRHSKGKTRAEANELTARVLAQVGLSDKANSYPSSCRAASSSAWPSRARSPWSRR